MEMDLFGPVPTAPRVPSKAASDAGRALQAARQAGRKGAKDCAEKAQRKTDPKFVEKATAHILGILKFGPRDGEYLVDRCIGVGIKPHDARAFGAVFMRLSKSGKARSRLTALPRRKGHGTGGLREWELVGE